MGVDMIWGWGSLASVRVRCSNRSMFCSHFYTRTVWGRLADGESKRDIREKEEQEEEHLRPENSAQYTKTHETVKHSEENTDHLRASWE